MYVTSTNISLSCPYWAHNWVLYVVWWNHGPWKRCFLRDKSWEGGRGGCNKFLLQPKMRSNPVSGVDVMSMRPYACSSYSNIPLSEEVVLIKTLHALCGVWDMWYGTVLVDIKIFVMNWDIWYQISKWLGPSKEKHDYHRGTYLKNSCNASYSSWYWFLIEWKSMLNNTMNY